MDIEISQIDDFEDHPFKVKDDEDMEKLMESIATYGVLTPVIIREKGDKYEMVSGHRRKHACERLGMETIPAVVKELTREEAIIAMTDSNIQREHILPSEKAWAYKMKMEAIKKTAGRPKINSRPLGENLWSVSEISKSTEESERQIHRYMYIFSATFAKGHDELDEYRASFRANVECKNAIEEAIANHYSDNRFDGSCVNAVVEQFGMERVAFVLANTIQHKDWDGRISPENKEWAKAEPVPNDFDAWHNKKTLTVFGHLKISSLTCSRRKRPKC